MKTNIQTKFFVLFAAAGLSIASAKTYMISVPAQTELAGTQLKSGDYRVKVEGATATLRSMGNKTLEVMGTVQASDTKFTETALETTTSADGASHIVAIDLGGTKTRLTFNN